MALKRYFLTPAPGEEKGCHLKEKGDKNPLLTDKSKARLMKVAIDLVRRKTGSLVIHKKDGKFQEERTYPKSADPISSKG